MGLLMLAHVLLLDFCMDTKVSRRNIDRRRNPGAGTWKTFNGGLSVPRTKLSRRSADRHQKKTTIFLGLFYRLNRCFSLAQNQEKLRWRDRPEEDTFMTQSHVQILVVDDERNIRNNLTTVLESAGYKVDASGDGEDALTKCKERHYDIALVDIQMPKMGGLELLRYLRTLRPNLPVVILTAYGTVGRAVEAMKLGAVDFLEKPFDPKVLLLLCEEIIQRQKM